MAEVYRLMANQPIDEEWPTLGGGTVHVYIPPERKRPWSMDTRSPYEHLYHEDPNDWRQWH